MSPSPGWLWLCTALFAMGCHSSPTHPANDDCAGGPALEITIRDSVTGAFAASGAWVIASNSVKTDSVYRSAVEQSADSVPIRIGIASGTYRVTIRKPGYVDWIRNVEVPLQTDGPCTGEPVRTLVNARLQRGSP